MAAAPLWLLDIDGVVNALATGIPTGAWPRDAWVQRMVPIELPGRGTTTLPVLAARPVLEFLTAVSDAGRAEIRWHSTWRATAATALAPMLGLPRFGISVAPEWQDQPTGTWWKLPAAERAISAGRRLVWTDDDLDTYRRDQRTAAALAAMDAYPEALVLPVDPRTGLTPDDLARIDAFLG